ncbi:MAG: tetraacyldisaccharide 4'-kinase [Acidobacteria bacterium]|uniref:Tetraacyldisaccharide 4'-kinase n=1 Tax=Candidatus Polarisedimenticola svalbardensis TaxID=2886004 RepID=A0A8J6Y056_9BACT|nr:tetraacyldisaccharide 4'-kinase [Candidatus Polarisedimenticola svalbardensis]
MTFPRNRWILALLGLPALLFSAVTRVRNRYYDRPASSRSAGLPVIAIGNLTVGGTGKTPVVQWLCRRLLAEGEQPAVITRGYGGKAGVGPLVVSRGRGPEIPAERCGDEPYLLAESLEGVRVVAGSDRIACAREARLMGATVAVLDDGFQHRRLRRDLDIVLLDRQAPLGNGRHLPAGPLREHPSGLRRAGVVLVTRSEEGDDLSDATTLVRSFNPTAPIVAARHVPDGFADSTGRSHQAPQSVFGFCGIARPESFLRNLERTGVTVSGFRPFPDHHPFSDRELAELAAAAAGSGASLVTTRKDLARMSGRNHPALPAILSLGLDLVIDRPDVLMEAVRGAVSGRKAT